MSGSGAALPSTLEELMAQAFVMESEAAQRYSDMADVLETHNNHEVAGLFRTIAGYEARHAELIKEQMGWSQPPTAAGPGSTASAGVLEVEAPAFDELHYLMQPWHALQLALGVERRAAAHFALLAASATDEAMRRAALEMQAEEREHIALIEEWLAKVPQPQDNWADDPDPPRYTD